MLTNTVFTFSQSVELNRALEKFSDSGFLLYRAATQQSIVERLRVEG